MPGSDFDQTDKESEFDLRHNYKDCDLEGFRINSTMFLSRLVLNLATFTKLIIVLSCTISIGCTTTGKSVSNESKETYQIQTDREGDIGKTATVELGKADWAEVSGDNLDQIIFIGFRKDLDTNYSAISLRPGTYKISWGKKIVLHDCFGFICDKRISHPSFNSLLYVEGDHTYRLQTGIPPKRFMKIKFVNLGHSGSVYFWVRDLETGEYIGPKCLSDDGESFMRVQRLAESGDMKAQYQLGLLYESRVCVRHDYSKSVTWFSRAAEQGHDMAQYKTGRFYHTGTSGELNLEKAWNWYLKSAEQGNTEAEYLVGLFYHKGIVVDQDLEQAQLWYQRAADKGHTSAMSSLENLQNEL